MLVDSNRHILMLNPAMGKLLQLQAETDEQFDANVKSAGAYLENILNSSQETLLSGKTTTSESTTPDGRYLRALFSPLTLRDADLRYVVIVIEDITEEKILERSKDDFFSIATHELRTPLTAIRGSTELITDFYTEALQDDRLKSLIANIHNSSERLLSIVNDFLDASKLEQGSFKLKPQTIYIKTVIQTVLQEISSVAEKKSLYVKADMGSLGTLPFVHADPERVEQILYNLIGNALKFVETGGVTVAADVQGNMLKVYVTDTGRGISAENQQLLFRKFQQANAGILVRDSSPGTGLGLYIAKMLTEAMGGTIGLESSELDVGSCFSFSLPLAKDKDPETLVG
jgi:signal transduction histidine kinase